MSAGGERVSVRGEVVEGGLDVDGLPEHDDVDHDAEAGELVFLTDLVVLAELAALPVEDVRFVPAQPAGRAPGSRGAIIRA